jgi:HAD superfamily hydrolase (TIGR01484 family)
MPYRALATDYDGTLADAGKVDAETLAALVHLRRAGWRLVLVTGRELDDLMQVFPHLDLFHRVVAENGALLYRPEERTERRLCEAPPHIFLQRLRERGVDASMGRVIVATRRPFETEVLEVIAELRLDLRVIFNKGAVMALPSGIDKGSGLEAALAELGVGWQETVAVGDAENDLEFVSRCALAVAVANALPVVKERAQYITARERGAGVREAIAHLLDELCRLQRR